MNQPATILLLVRRVDCNDGVASYLESLVTGLRDTGDRSVIVSGRVTTLYGSESRRRSLEAAALDWVVLDDFRPSRPKPAHLQNIRSVIERHAVDVVSPQGFSVLPFGYFAGRMSGRPVVTNYHPSLSGDQSGQRADQLSAAQQVGYRVVTATCKSDRYIAMSSDIEALFRDRFGIPQRRIHKQMLGVETDFYRRPSEEERCRARERFGLDSTTFVSVLPGRMNFNKRHGVAAAAFRRVRAQRPEVAAVCLFPGGGDQREAIETDVLRDEADRRSFRFLGFVDRETLRDAYWAADIVLLPSRVEGFGMVVAEAMCCGAIAIRTPSGGWQDQIIDGKTGYAVPFDDPVALASAIEKVLDSPNRRAMREEAMQLASTKFAKSRMIEGTSGLYREVAALGRLRRARSFRASA